MDKNRRKNPTINSNSYKTFLILAVLFSMFLMFVSPSVATINFETLPSIAEGLISPEDVAVAADGTVYVVDSEQDKVIIFDGSGLQTDSIVIAQPTSVAAADNGTLYIGSAYDMSVKIVNGVGQIIGALGSGVQEFQLPLNISIDKATGNIFVVDQPDHSIKVYTPSGGFLFKIDDFPNLPQDVTLIDSEIFVLDYPLVTDGWGGLIRGARVQVFNSAGEPTRNFGFYGSKEGQFIRPKGITTDNGNIFVTDSFYRVVMSFTSSGGYLGSIQDPQAAMIAPLGAAVGNGKLFVASPNTANVAVFGIDNAFVYAQISTQPSELDFSNIAAGEISATQTITVSSTGSADLALGTLTISGSDYGQFEINADTCSNQILAINDTCLIGIFALPNTTGPKTANLVIPSNATNFQGLQVPLAVNGVTPPSGSITINSGALFVNDSQVTLTLSSTDASFVRFSNNNISYTDWEDFVVSKIWLLPENDGPKTLFVQIKDDAGIIATLSADITLDTLAPDAPIPGNGINGGGETSLTWQQVPGASSYTIEYANNPEYTDPVTVEAIATNRYSFTTSLVDGTWYWRVRSVDAAGNKSGWSSSHSFIVNLPCESIPNSPDLMLPTYGDDNISASVTLVSGNFTDSQSCGIHWKTEWQVSEFEDFHVLTLGSGAIYTHLTNFQVPLMVLEPSTTYYWRTRYFDTAGTSSNWSNVFMFKTEANADDLNLNGIPDIQEVDASVDMNQDGTPDRDQDDIIKCVNTTNAGEPACIDSSSPSMSAIVAMKVIDQDNIVDTENRPDIIPGNLIGYKVQVANPGDSITMTVYLSETASPDARWFKYDSLSGWQDYSDHAVFSTDRTSVEVEIQDGGYGDADGTANMTIIDPSGLGIVTASSAPAVSSGVGSGGGGGGCFITVADTRPVAISGRIYYLLLLPVLMVFLLFLNVVLRSSMNIGPHLLRKKYLRKIMRILPFLSIIVPIIFLVIFTNPGPGIAVELSAPHSSGNHIYCGSCHGAPLYTSPMWGGYYEPFNKDDTSYNSLCISCHNATSPPYSEIKAPKARTHSSLTTSGQYGEWSTQCRECHAPHNNEQILWQQTAADQLFLATGEVITYSWDETKNTSTLFYETISYKNGWQPSRLLAKSGLNREVTIYPNLADVNTCYSIIVIDEAAGSITVKGDVSLTLASATLPASFGMIYGQIIKQFIEVGVTELPVKFFDNSGMYSFAYDDSGTGLDPTPDGICQVCHTATRHFINDGTVSLTGSHDELSGTNCIICHSHASGFTGTPVDHSIKMGTNSVCSTCHTGPEIVEDIHRNFCSVCHNLPDFLPLEGSRPLVLNSYTLPLVCSTCHPAIEGEVNAGLHPPNVDHASLSHITMTAGCAVCHTGSDPVADIHGGNCSLCHETLPDLKPGISRGECSTCHGNYFYLHQTPDHSATITATNSCIVCHADTDFITGTHNNLCSNCHDSTGNMVAGTYGDATINSGNGGNCVECHNGYFEGHIHDHANEIKENISASPKTSNCIGCHNQSDLVTGIHSVNGCTTCHNLSNGTLYAPAIAGGGECIVCHSNYFSSHSHNHSIALTSTDLGQSDGQPCSNCHSAGSWTEIASTEHNVSTNGAGSCSTCHNSSRAEVIAAITGGGNVDCLDCHAAKAAPATHGSSDHSNVGTGGYAPLRSTAQCVNCHTQTNLAVGIHANNSCSTCHTAPPTLNAAASSAAGSGGECTTCHSNGFVAHTHDHAASVTATAQCVNCHTGNQITSVHTDCGSCHSATTGGRIAGTYGDATVNNGNGGTCANCHSTYFAGHTHDHANEVKANTATTPKISNCISCHNQSDPVTGIHAAIGCATCHNLINGSLISPAIAGGGECNTCHTTYFDDHSHVHAVAQASTDLGQSDAQSCSNCHSAGSWNEIANTEHNVGTNGAGSCATCHNSNRAEVVSTIATGGNVSCLDCHSAKAAPATHGSTNHSAVGSGGYTPLWTTALCVNCHTQTDLADGIHANNSCSTCHTAPPTLNAASAPAIGSGGECITCHTSGFEVHPHDHVASVIDTALCINCHTGNRITTVHTGCISCHSPTTGNLIIGTNGNATVNNNNGGSCAECHSNYFGGHTHAHSMNSVSLCLNCHSVSNAPFTGNGQPHAASGCLTCHSATTGVLQGSSVGANGGENCQDCHSSYFGDHNHNHAASVTDTTSCINCHTANDPMAVHNNSCASCHSPSSGALIAGANGWGDATVNNGNGGTCQNCHAAYFAAHIHSHTIALGSNDLAMADSRQCNICHNDNGGSLSTWTDIYVEHLNSCATCHESLRSEVQTAITAGANPTNCLNCHSEKAAPASHGNIDHVGQGVVIGTTACTDCHDPTGNSNESHYIGSIHNRTGYGCSTCHVASGGGGPLHDYSGSGGIVMPGDAVNYETINNGVGGECLDCHAGSSGTSDFDQFDNFTGLANGTRPGFGNWTGVNGSDGTMGWVAFTGSTGSSNTGPTSGGPYVYLESSGTNQAYGVGVTGGSNQYIESNIIDASQYTDLTFSFDWHMNVSNNTDSSLHLDAFNGNDWDLDINGTEVNIGNNGDVWMSEGPIDLSGYTNTDFKLRIRYDVGSGSIYRNDVAVDNLHFSATAGQAVDYHPPKNHTATVTITPNCATTCHTSSDVTGSTHAGNCLQCHASTRTEVIDTIRAGSGNCSTCHTAYAEDYESGHQNETHAELIVTTSSTPTLDCGGCHTGDIISIEHNRTKGCDNCHLNTTDNGTLVSLAATHVLTTTKACADCHGTDYFSSHAHTHTVRQNLSTDLSQPNSQPCNGCHNDNGGNLNDWTAIFVEHLSDCSTCHDSTRTEVRNAISSGANQTECLDCHSSKAAPTEHGGHVSSDFNWESLCQNCHGSADIINTVHMNNCGLCHQGDTPGAALIGSAGNATWGANPHPCTECHTASFDGHSHTHSMNTETLCQNCHTASTAPFIGSGQTHAVAGCQTCHSSTTGALIGSAVGASGGINCQGCHSGFNSHAHDHNNSVTGPTNTSTITNNCLTSGCHVASSAPFTGSSQTHATASCQTCHSVQTGSLIGSAGGNPNGGECATCHFTYFNGHTQHTATSHAVLQRTADQTSGAACNVCHRRGGTGSGNPLFSNSWSGTNGIYGLHASNCVICHDSARTTATTGTSIQDIIQNGTNIGCLDCHADRVASHGGHAVDDFSWTSSCGTSSCHNLAGSSDIVQSQDVHKGDCTLCHVDPTGGDYSLQSYAVGKTRTATCANCHAGTMADNHHTNVNATNGNCTWCHADPRPDVNNTGIFSTARGVTQLACRYCHANGNSNSGGGIIYRATYTPGTTGASSNNCGSYNTMNRTAKALDGTGGTVDHIFGASSIQNYGACLGCHLEGYGNATRKIGLFHARPANWYVNSNNQLLGNDTNGNLNDDQFCYYYGAPGRGTFNVFGNDLNDQPLGDLRGQGAPKLCRSGTGKIYESCTSSQEKHGKDYMNNRRSNWNNPASGFGTTMTIPCGSHFDQTEDWCGGDASSNSDNRVPHF